MKLALVIGLALAFSSVASGCGAVIIRHSDVETVDWPPSVSTPHVERPTALVRLVNPHRDETEETRSFDDLIASFRAPFSSGLFSSVSYQVGTEHMASRADVVLDISLSSRDAPFHWTGILGLATLGVLPVPLTDVHEARITVRDGDGKALGEVRAENRLTSLFWTPLLPFNMCVGLVDPMGVGGKLGLDVQAWAAIEREFTENLVRVALLRAHERFGFRRPGPGLPLPPGDAAKVEAGK